MQSQVSVSVAETESIFLHTLSYILYNYLIIGYIEDNTRKSGMLVFGTETETETIALKLFFGSSVFPKYPAF